MAVKKIFIIDDDRNLLNYLERRLSEAGYEVFTALSGLEAIEMLAGQTVDVVFTDYFLPHLSGERICKIIRRMEHLKHVYLVIMSAAALEMQLDLSETGVNALIAKGSFKEMARLLLSTIEDVDNPTTVNEEDRTIGFDAVYPRRMTKELLDHSHHLQTVLDSISEGIVEIYRGCVVYVNPAAENLLGKPRDQLLAGSMSDLFETNPVFKMVSGEPSGSQDSVAVGKHQTYRSDDKTLWVKRLALPGDDDTLILLITDVTDRIRSEESLRNYQQHLETLVEKRTSDLKRANERLLQIQKMEALGTIAGGVAHDLNNILSGIVSYPELLLMDLPEPSSLRTPILTIKKSGEKAAAIVHDLLTLARRGVATENVVSLNVTVSEYLKSPEFEKMKSYHAEMRVGSCLGDNLLNIKGSPVHLSKTLMNLVSNAAEAMPDGGKVVISTENRYLDREIKGYENIKKGEYVILTVADTGIGISNADMGSIFEPFYTKKKMGRSGTGLGMAVVWGTVKDHRGYIDIHSAEGKGTTFRLYFPVTRESPASEKYPVTIESYMGKGESILIVDDAREQREIASGILTKLGYAVFSVSSGEEAVDYLAGDSADLLVLDMIMEPGIDGLETYRRILELRPGQKAIIASGFSETERIVAAQKLGAGQYVKKPYTLEMIGTAVRDELDKA